MIAWAIAKAKAWAAAMGGLILLVGAAFIYGRREGRQAANSATEKKNAAAATKARGVENEIDGLDSAGIDKRLDKWMRD